MIVNGLPAFDRPLRSAGIQILAPNDIYTNKGQYVLLPHALTIASRANGSADFALDIVRGVKPSMPPSPHGILDFRMVPDYRMDAGLEALRDRHPQASLTTPTFTQGFLRLVLPIADRQARSVNFSHPRPLLWNGLENARFRTKLPINDAVFLEQSLRDGVLNLEAIAEVEMLGLSPQFPLTIRFDPFTLLTALQQFGGTEVDPATAHARDSPPSATAEFLIARATVVKFFQQARSQLPLQMEGNIDDIDADQSAERLAETITDWVRMRWGRFVATPGLDLSPESRGYMALPSPQSVDRGQFIWDLSQPHQAQRPLILSLGNPFDAALRLVQAQGIDGIVFHSTIPSLPRGNHHISLVANIPQRQQGILALGVRVQVPANPPWRFRPITKTQELIPPSGPGDRPSSPHDPNIELRLTPLESLRYQFSTFAVVQDARGIEQLEGAAQDASGEMLYVDAADFPIDFLTLDASRTLLDIANIQGICRRPDQNGDRVIETFSLTLETPEVAIALLKNTMGQATLEIQAQEKGGDRVVTLGPIPAQPMRLSEHSFAEYGPQKVSVTCQRRSTESGLVVFEFLPEDGNQATDSRQLFFTPQDRQKEWRWFARSPFASRYRYRRTFVGPSAPPPEEWSAYQSPLKPLILTV
ncbi:MAG: hypothetical protein AAGD25_24485 [Cyanobacteria bacterium P01_F01_bin.150]